MLGRRTLSAYVELSDGSFWILGGLDSEDWFTTEIYSEGVFSPGPELPTLGYNDRPCAVQVGFNSNIT